MGALAWIVAPAIAGEHRHLIPVLVVCFTAGLIWQFVLVLLLNGFSLRELWPQRPSTSDGRGGSRLWLWVLPFVRGFGALQFVPFDLPTVGNHGILGDPNLCWRANCLRPNSIQVGPCPAAMVGPGQRE